MLRLRSLVDFKGRREQFDPSHERLPHCGRRAESNNLIDRSAIAGPVCATRWVGEACSSRQLRPATIGPAYVGTPYADSVFYSPPYSILSTTLTPHRS